MLFFIKLNFLLEYLEVSDGYMMGCTDSFLFTHNYNLVVLSDVISSMYIKKLYSSMILMILQAPGKQKGS